MTLANAVIESVALAVLQYICGLFICLLMRNFRLVLVFVSF